MLPFIFMEIDMSKFVASPQQAAFLDWVVKGSGSCVLEAVAGAGKTTTLIEAVERTQGSVALLAYNRKIADEIKAKLKKRGIDWKKANANTVHGFGLGAYKKAFPKVQVNGGKVTDILVKLGEKAAPQHPVRMFSSIVADLVSLAKQRALGVFGSIDDTSKWYDIIEHFDILGNEEEEAQNRVAEIVEAAIAVLKLSNTTTDVVDFDDMVYLPVLLKLRFWTYPWVFVDEAQDTNPARRALVKAILAPGGRVVAVGDRRQAIYGFTGADANALDLIKSDFNAVDMPLTVTYRCPKSVVKVAHRWVSHIQAHESAPEGSTSVIVRDDIFDRNDLDGTAAILCRNTKPLVALAFELIRSNIACRVEGRDIGKGLVKLATKWKTVKTLHGLETAVAKWAEGQIVRAKAKGNGAMAQQIADQAATMRVITEQCRKEGKDSIPAVVEHINGLFEDNVDNMLVLSTIHKSKGREWETVYWLDRANTLPSPYATQDWQLEQENNLCYVAATRAKASLIEVVVPH